MAQPDQGLKGPCLCNCTFLKRGGRRAGGAMHRRRRSQAGLPGEQRAAWPPHGARGAARASARCGLIPELYLKLG